MATKKPAPAKKTAPKKVAVKKAAPVKAAPAKKGLNYQQRLFVAEYLKDRNATQAAIRAGYAEKSAHSQAHDILKKPDVQALLEESIQRVAAKCELSVERTLKEVARIAFFDPRKLFGSDGNPLELTALDDDTAAAIQGVDVLEEFDGTGEDRKFVGYVKKYKVADKNSALEKAMKHFGLYEQDNKQKVNPLADLIAAMGGKSAMPVSK